jgi:D-glycero-D-manno-heptose 1,7-bisphosphate phosphatase
MHRAVILDRDGVINKSIVVNGKPFPPNSVTEVEIFDDVSFCVSELRNEGFEIVVVTNQPDIARGKTNSSEVEKIHNLIRDKTGIKDFFVCPHDDSDNCNCRKPRIGLLVQAANALDLDLQRSFMVGDRWRDMEAGQKAGCSCFFINNKYSEQLPKPPYIEVESLSEATKIIIEANK